MTRPLGSFNRLVNLTRHPEDRAKRGEEEIAKQAKATLEYTLGLTRNKPEREEAIRTNAEKFVSGRVAPPRESAGMRMAGVELRNQLAQM